MNDDLNHKLAVAALIVLCICAGATLFKFVVELLP